MGDSDCKRIPTSAEVWSVIYARHHGELDVFSSFSDPEGTFNGGGGDRGKMFTGYGFRDCECPFMECETTWTIVPDSYDRTNVENKYWLCIPEIDGD